MQLVALSKIECNEGWGLRLLLLVLLKAKEKFVMMIGFPCSSFVAMSRASTYRHYFMPLGDRSIPSVESANVLASRP